VPVVPALAAALPATVAQRTAFDYHGPGSLPDGGVLVVGASATGVQLAAELRRAGRAVTLAVGEHVRLPRRYRGRDIFWWLHATGVLAERHDLVDDLSRARRLPSPQLVGSAVPVDLAALVAGGVRLVGRLMTVDGGLARFSGCLRNVCALADLKQARFLARADEWAAGAGLDDELPPPSRPSRTPVPDRPCLALDLAAEQIGTVVWATGFRPDHSWVELPVLDRTGRLRHDGGIVTDAPGLYALGLPLLRTRASTYIHGAAADTEALADHLVAHLAR
jgi:putative flavoprotein involved in K+ transport